MITRIRRWLAVALAVLVTLLTLGRVRVSWTGRGSVTRADDDRGRAAATRTWTPPGDRG